MAEEPSHDYRVLRRALGLMALVAWGLVLRVHGVAIVRGGSMSPALEAGDIVIYKRDECALSAGDIVLFRRAGDTHKVLHRVVAIRPDRTITTRGDANEVSDRDPVTRADVLGVVVAVLPTGQTASALEERLR
ncbi:MAG: signal peptidase I [Actinomycetia bacterium]|nr:signal peptidase I [Actinomycetes bacterium]